MLLMQLPLNDLCGIETNSVTNRLEAPFLVRPDMTVLSGPKLGTACLK